MDCGDKYSPAWRLRVLSNKNLSSGQGVMRIFLPKSRHGQDDNQYKGKPIFSASVEASANGPLHQAQPRSILRSFFIGGIILASKKPLSGMQETGDCVDLSVIALCCFQGFCSICTSRSEGPVCGITLQDVASLAQASTRHCSFIAMFLLALPFIIRLDLRWEGQGKPFTTNRHSK